MSPKPRSKENRGLPRRWRVYASRKGGRVSYYYRPREHEKPYFDGRAEFLLGHSLGEAHAAFAARMQWLDEVFTMTQLCERYELHVIPLKAPATRKSNQYSMKRIRAAFGNNPVAAIEPVHIYRFRDEVARRYSQKAANLDLEVLSHMFTRAIEWGCRSDHPMTNKKVVKFSLAPRDRYVEDHELKAAMSVAPALIAAYVPLKLLTGLRKAEILSIQLSDLRDDGIHVQRKKGQLPVIYEWTDELELVVESVKALRKKVTGLYLFSNRKGKPYIKPDGTTSGFDSIWQRFMAKALKETDLSERFTEHDLRAKVGSEADNVARAQELLGHSTAAVTKRVYRRKATRVKPTR